MTRKARLPAYAIFAAFLASAGLPLYIHAPKFYVDEYGVSLAALGAMLFGLRLLDVVQDPALGWLARRVQDRRRLSVALGGAVLVAGMLGLFLVSPPIAPLWWFAAMLTLVFSSFSYLTICFYAEGVRGAMEGAGYLAVARWRETGALLGICAASVAPLALGGYGAFALAFAGLGAVAVVAMRREWRKGGVGAQGFATVLADRTARRLLLIALVNAAPVAVSSTLFLFYVESVLQAQGWEGPLLLLFFLCAAASAPVWGRLAERWGAKPVLLGAMTLAIASFAGAVMLGPGDAWIFALICVVSGVAVGADLTLLPAMFAHRMEAVSPGASEAFGLWSFVSKFTLAVAAVTLLPLLQAGGFEAGSENDPRALRLLALAYGAVPCGLKLVAIALLAVTQLDDKAEVMA
ncbi:MFS transporter [Roseovarius sp. SCSIO 43702]|uniref:MFS transporter n=1 Tax=Roseovarius sp. SCSIO 43702 TaxID=2823043 RepID=UPI001C72CA2E|nr:MFS transporter [Roseovarius sp. SCSIO 43702]QYX57234.1 MFS transporter [Roseovarius sp. SCSIO 43702]